MFLIKKSVIIYYVIGCHKSKAFLLCKKNFTRKQSVCHRISIGDFIMNNKNKRLYNSIRFNSVIGNILVSILFIIFFVGTFVFASGFFIEYIIESKFAEEQERISTISKMYEEGKDSKDIKRILDASDTSFIVVDSKDKVVYQNGENTCGANGKYITMDNGSEQMFVYPDTKADYLYPKDNGSLGFKFKEFSNKLVELYNDGDIYFSLTSEEVHSFNLNTSEEDEGVVVSYYKNEKACLQGCFLL